MANITAKNLAKVGGGQKKLILPTSTPEDFEFAERMGEYASSSCSAVKDQRDQLLSQDQQKQTQVN